MGSLVTSAVGSAVRFAEESGTGLETADGEFVSRVGAAVGFVVEIVGVANGKTVGEVGFSVMTVLVGGVDGTMVGGIQYPVGSSVELLLDRVGFAVGAPVGYAVNGIETMAKSSPISSELSPRSLLSSYPN